MKKMVSGYSHNARCKLPQASAPKGLPGYGRKDFSPPVGYSDRSLANVSPLKQQFEPTDSSPIRQRQRMGGMS